MLHTYYKNPESTADCIKALQKSVGLTIPQSTLEWMDVPRTEVDIRHNMVVQDGIRAAGKRRFDPSKLIRVNCLWIVISLLSEIHTNELCVCTCRCALWASQLWILGDQHGSFGGY